MVRGPNPHAPEGEVLVSVNDLVVRYGDLTAVDGVSFTARRGEVLALLGPNGAGKTSTVETLEGYRRPAAGTVRVCGLDPVTEHRSVVQRIGVMLQGGGIHNQMRVGETLSLFAAYYPDPLDPAGLAARVGLDHRMRSTWRSLSGGEQQRLSLALAVIGRPEVVFLDEPTAGVDPAGRVTVRELITELGDEGVCVVLTTHDLADAEKVADRVVVVDHGRVLADGTIAALTGAARTSFTFSVEVASDSDDGVNAAELGAVLGAIVTDEGRGRYRVGTSPSPDVVAALTSWLAARNLGLGDLHAGRRSLEDVFLELTSDGDVGHGETTP
jgi:ABC-2 type transport system ATP-binding protein